MGKYYILWDKAGKLEIHVDKALALQNWREANAGKDTAHQNEYEYERYNPTEIWNDDDEVYQYNSRQKVDNNTYCTRVNLPDDEPTTSKLFFMKLEEEKKAGGYSITHYLFVAPCFSDLIHRLTDHFNDEHNRDEDCQRCTQEEHDNVPIIHRRCWQELEEEISKTFATSGTGQGYLQGTQHEIRVNIFTVRHR